MGVMVGNAGHARTPTQATRVVEQLARLLAFFFGVRSRSPKPIDGERRQRKLLMHGSFKLRYTSITSDYVPKHMSDVLRTGLQAIDSNAKAPRKSRAGKAIR